MRLFIGVNLSENQRAEAHRLQQRLQLFLNGVRWVSPQAMHITLKFLGEVSPGQLPGINGAIRRATARASRFEFRMKGLGVFPSRSRARVIWNGVREGRPEIENLNLQLEAELSPLGFLTETRPFHPHLTLGRAGSPLPWDLISLALNQEKDFATARERIDRIVLYRSHLLREGAKHEVLYEEILADGAGKRETYPE